MSLSGELILSFDIFQIKFSLVGALPIMKNNNCISNLDIFIDVKLPGIYSLLVTSKKLGPPEVWQTRSGHNIGVTEPLDERMKKSQFVY